MGGRRNFGKISGVCPFLWSHYFLIFIQQLKTFRVWRAHISWATPGTLKYRRRFRRSSLTKEKNFSTSFYRSSQLMWGPEMPQLGHRATSGPSLLKAFTVCLMTGSPLYFCQSDLECKCTFKS